MNLFIGCRVFYGLDSRNYDVISWAFWSYKFHSLIKRHCLIVNEPPTRGPEILEWILSSHPNYRNTVKKSPLMSYFLSFSYRADTFKIYKSNICATSAIQVPTVTRKERLFAPHAQLTRIRLLLGWMDVWIAHLIELWPFKEQLAVVIIANLELSVRITTIDVKVANPEDFNLAEGPCPAYCALWVGFNRTPDKSNVSKQNQVIAVDIKWWTITAIWAT